MKDIARLTPSLVVDKNGRVFKVYKRTDLGELDKEDVSIIIEKNLENMHKEFNTLISAKATTVEKSEDYKIVTKFESFSIKGNRKIKEFLGRLTKYNKYKLAIDYNPEKKKFDLVLYKTNILSTGYAPITTINVLKAELDPFMEKLKLDSDTGFVTALGPKSRENLQALKMASKYLETKNIIERVH